MAMIGLHALARLYERGRPHDDAEVVSCLAPLFEAAPGQDEMPAPRGRWALRWRLMRVVGTDEHKRLLCVRTFLED